MPVPDRAPGTGRIAVTLGLLLVHGALYWFGARLRGRFGVVAYALAQAAVLLGIAIARVEPPVVLGLFAACTAEMIMLGRGTLGATTITGGAIGLFVLASLITSDLYRAMTAGLLLTATGLVFHALATALRRREVVTEAPVDSAVRSNEQTAISDGKDVTDAGLTARELEVLRELVAGASNGEIAVALGIAERTVKAHAGSIYQKLGVQSRAAAVAVALRRRLI
jgi:DNA-binding CsgD family transcriptional regulator